ncbi:putative ferric-chelate reductase 1 [Pungitius pungitius]|uniref:putative ferric-chelate reductase 1 n=1 Tax=Pungitius pungitius TaxID=134920 RepID=UPI002E0F8DC1
MTVTANATWPANMTVTANATRPANMTIPTSPIVAANATVTANATRPANATTAAHPLNTDSTVETLQTPLSRAACGTTELCVAEPSSCDPSTSSCFFLSAMLISGNKFAFGLSGESDGYIAATLSPDATLGGNDPTYVCANNRGAVKFVSTFLNNGHLTVTVLNVSSVKGKVDGRNIQCTFATTVPTPAARASNSVLAVSTGHFNSTSGTLGRPTPRIQSSVVDLANPKVTVINNVALNTTSHAMTFHQSLTQVVLITVGVLRLATF